MTEPIQPRRPNQVPPEMDPTGERLLDRTLRPFQVWIPTHNAIVLGNSQDAEKELNVEAVQRDSIPVFKRMSGGGAVLLSPGCVCLGLRFAKRKNLTIADYFAKASALISEVALEKLGVTLRLRGTSDLACPINELQLQLPGANLAAVASGIDGLEDRKVAGSALYMPRDFVLYLVSILVNPVFSDFEKYLAHPSKEPPYRGKRSHAQFLASLSSLSAKSIKAEDVQDWFARKIPTLTELDLDWELAGP